MKKFLTVLLVLIVACVVFIATRPGSFHIERSATIAAAPEAVYPHVADLHQWEAWSPWEHLDPTMKRSYGGAESGVGSSYEWTGNDKVGQGRMTITDATPPSHVGIKLEFLKPFTATNTCTFTFAPEGSGTKVTWAMDGTNNFVAKAFGLMMNMDKTVGGDFERGLASLRTVAESAPANAMPADSTAAKPS